MRFIVFPAVAIAAVIAGCGSTDPVTGPPSSVPTVEPAASTVLQDTAAVQDLPGPTSSDALVLDRLDTLELQSILGRSPSAIA